jgi:arylsulfatase
LSGLDSAAAPNVIARSFSITADLDLPEGGEDGMIVTLGGRFGGYGLYLLKGKPVFTYNLLALERFRWEGQEALAGGKHNIVFDFRYNGPGVGKGGAGILKVDGAEVASRSISHTIPFLMTIDETFDIGEDTRTPVDDRDYQVPFRFTGTIEKLTVRLGRPQLAENDIKAMHASLLAAKD